MIHDWECPTSEQWERFILDSDMKDRDKLEEHLKKCNKCRYVVDEYRRDFKKLQEVWKESVLPRIYYLSQYNIDFEYHSESKTLLAAQSTEESEPNSITLSSPSHDVFLRVVSNSNTDEIWLYAISDEPELYANVLVKPFSREEEYLTDDKGRVNLGKVKWPASNELKAEIKLPQATFSLKPIENLTDEELSYELKSPASDRIKVLLSDEEKIKKLTVQILDASKSFLEKDVRVVIKGSGVVKILPIKNNITDKVSINDEELQGELLIYLF